MNVIAQITGGLYYKGITLAQCLEIARASNRWLRKTILKLMKWGQGCRSVLDRMLSMQEVLVSISSTESE